MNVKLFSELLRHVELVKPRVEVVVIKHAEARNTLLCYDVRSATLAQEDESSDQFLPGSPQSPDESMTQSGRNQHRRKRMPESWLHCQLSELIQIFIELHYGILIYFRLLFHFAIII